MLWHIRPRLYSPFEYVELIDMEINPPGIHLSGGVDLATRRPYPNKHYAVACRKEGRKAIDGILIETPAPIDELRIIALWAVEATSLVTHHVHYKLLDRLFDAASTNMSLWRATYAEDGGWSNRWPESINDVAPVHAEPTMEVIPRKTGRRSEDILDERTGWIAARREVFAMPTIERERIVSTKFSDRVPHLSAAFRLFS